MVVEDAGSRVAVDIVLHLAGPADLAGEREA
jgi:hypothetical protein